MNTGKSTLLNCPVDWEDTDISCICGHFLRWPEAYPTRAETAQVVVKKLLSEILPRFGLPLFMGSNNGPAFIAKVTQSLVKARKVTWKLHCVYRPQSSGQVERMNGTLKNTLTKLKLETGENWVSLLPFALLRARCIPYVKGLTPFEIMSGRPPPLLPRLREEELAVLSNRNLLRPFQALQSSTAAASRSSGQHTRKPTHRTRTAHLSACLAT